MAALRNSNIRVPGVTKDSRGIWWCDVDGVPRRAAKERDVRLPAVLECV